MTRAALFTVAALAASLACARARAVAAPADGLDVVDYDVTLSLDDVAGTLDGRATLTIVAPAGTEPVTLAAHGIEVRSASVDGRAVPFTLDGDSLRLAIGSSARDTVRLDLEWRARAGRGLRIAPGAAYTVFHTYGWLPCEFRLADRATLSLAVDVADGLSVVATGDPVDRTVLGGGRHRFRFRLDEPAPAYLFAFAAGPFTTISIDRVHGEFTASADSLGAAALARAFAPTPAMRAFFEERAGGPFPGHRYDQVVIADAPPQEAATLTLLSDGYARSVLEQPTEDYLIAHELAHQWWGNRVTAADWSHFWLHEGVATFMVAAWKEQRWGRAAYDREMDLARTRYARALATGGARPLVAGDPGDHEHAGGAVVYSLGALALDALRTELGDSAFWHAFADFTQRGLRTNAVTTADLQAAMEKASGRSLETFFEGWTRSDTVAAALPTAG